MTENNHGKIDLLKLDIEGFEYEVIDSFLNDKIEVNQICVEFHHFYKDINKRKTKKTIRKLLNAGYKIIHKEMLNFTFLKTGK
jgi:hypothetical protein